MYTESQPLHYVYVYYPLTSSSISADLGLTQLNLRSQKLAYHLAKLLANVWVSP